MTVSAWELTKYNNTGLSYHAGMKFNNRGAITCGLSGVTALSQFTGSPDGMNVDPVIANPTGLDSRFRHAACVFDEKMWISGGLYNATQSRSDILFSFDGKKWTKVYNSPDGIQGHKMVAFGNQRVNLVMLGGQIVENQADTYLDMIIKTSSGVDYDVVTPEGTMWAARSGFGCLVYKNKLFVFGGIGSVNGAATCFNDVWCTDDLIHWHRIIEHAPWGARSDFGYCEWDERMWIIGGKNVDGQRQGVTSSAEVWFSRDGLHWVRGFDFPTTVYATVAMPINNYIHVHGGVGNEHNIYKMRLG